MEEGEVRDVDPAIGVFRKLKKGSPHGFRKKREKVMVVGKAFLFD